LGLSRAFALGLRRLTEEWLVDNDHALLSRAFENFSRLPRDPAVMRQYFLAARAYIEHVAKRGFMHRAFSFLEQVSGYLARLSIDAPPQGPGQPESWAAAAAVEVLDLLIRRENSTFSILKRIDYDLSFLMADLDSLGGGRACRLALAKAYAEALFLIADSGCEVSRAPFKEYFEFVSGVAQDESLSREEREFVGGFWGDCVHAYMKILVKHEWLEEAAEMYECLPPPDAGDPDDLADRAAFLRSYVAAMQSLGHAPEALAWLSKFSALPLTPDVERLWAGSVDDLAGDYADSGDTETIRRLYRLLDRPNPCERAVVVRVKIAAEAIRLLCREGKLEEALTLYQETRELPLTKLSHNRYAQGLGYLIEAFGSRGETATAAHLFANRATIDLEEATRQPIKIAASRIDLTFKTRPSKQLANMTVALREMEESYLDNTSLAAKAVKLVEECLALGEEKRALTVYRSMESLRDVFDEDPANRAAILIIEGMVKSGRESEALALATARSEKLGPEDGGEFFSQFERLPRPSASKKKAKAR
jgi:tetratricopeptide (TPR) repeat protein